MTQHYAACVRIELIAPVVVHPWPGLLPIADAEGRAVNALNAATEGEFLLVRPDGYVGYRCPLGRFDLLSAWVKSVLIAQ